MSGVSVKLNNARCNMDCLYCYEREYREELSARPLNVEEIKKVMKSEKEQTGQTGMYLHGGEALAAPLSVVEDILAYGYELFGRTSLQTNGLVLTEEQIKLFKKYKTHVGVSFDGPWPLNRFRISQDEKMSKKATETIYNNIMRLRANGISVGVITVLTKANGLPAQRDAMKKWVKEATEIGIGGRLNSCVNHGPHADEILLTEEELGDFYADMAKFTLTEIDSSSWQPFRDIVDNLLGLQQGTCTFAYCDFYHAEAERAVLSDGTLNGCLKTSAETGNVYPRHLNDPASKQWKEIRPKILSETPYEYGGCQGCKYFVNCSGSCPAEAIDNDWRNRTYYCKAYYKLFETVEKLLRRMLPNVALTTDVPSDRFKGLSVQSGGFNAFGAILGSSMQSTWRGGKSQKDFLVDRSGGQKQQSKCAPGEAHQDGGRTMRPHGDKPHGDHTDHGDG